MRSMVAGGLTWLLLWQSPLTRAEELQWRPVASRPPVIIPMAGGREAAPVPTVTLSRPIALAEASAAPAPAPDQPVRWVAQRTPPDNPPRLIVRAQKADLPGPPPPPPPDSGLPSGGDDRYNCGVVTENPGPGNPILEGGRRLLSGIPWKGTGGAPAGSRCQFQSDHTFDYFISPVTNPFLFEDPRSLTEVRPIFMYQHTPNKNYIFQGGDMEFYGVQARLALTERWSVVLNKLGYLAIQPDNGPDVPEFHDASGFSEINIGPKFTFLRDDSCKRVGALGVTFEIPVGPHRVFQNTGNLSIVPYLSLAQNFGSTSYGSFNALGTVGYSFATDNKRSDYLFTSLHLDYNIANANTLYPFIELNWFHYTSDGHAIALGFEGRDLINFGSTDVAKDDDNVTLAVGARYKFSECVQTGVAAEFPINSRRDLLDFRLTFDLIFRY